MKSSILNKLLLKQAKPVEKLIPPIPVTAMGTSAAKKVKGTMSKQSFDTLFTKQNPALASQMAQRGLIFDRISHRWVKKPENRAQPQTVPTDKLSRQKESERISDEIIQDRNRKIYHHSELTSDDLRDDKFRSELQRSRGQNDPQRYFDAYKQIYGSEQRYSWVQLHSKLSSKEKRERNSEKEQKGFATENWRWSKDPTKKRLDKVEIGFLNALTQENDHAGAMEHIAQFLGDKHLANRASKNRAMRDERRTSTDDRRWSKFNRRVLTEISDATNERIKNISEVNRAM